MAKRPGHRNEVEDDYAEPEEQATPEPRAEPTGALKYGTIGVDDAGNVWHVGDDGILVQVGSIPVGAPQTTEED